MENSNSGGNPSRRRTIAPNTLDIVSENKCTVKSKFIPEQKIQIVSESTRTSTSSFFGKKFIVVPNVMRMKFPL